MYEHEEVPVPIDLEVLRALHPLDPEGLHDGAQGVHGRRHAQRLHHHRNERQGQGEEAPGDSQTGREAHVGPRCPIAQRVAEEGLRGEGPGPEAEEAPVEEAIVGIGKVPQEQRPVLATAPGHRAEQGGEEEQQVHGQPRAGDLAELFEGLFACRLPMTCRLRIAAHRAAPAMQLPVAQGCA